MPNTFRLTPPKTSDLILDAVDRLIQHYGYKKLTMEDVAQAAGVSKRTIYMYFPSKSGLALSSLERMIYRVHDELGRIENGRESAETTLRKMLRRRILGRYESTVGLATSMDEVFSAIRSDYMKRRAFYFEKERAMFVRVLSRGNQCGEFDVESPEQTAEALLLATNAFLPYTLSLSEIGGISAIESKLDALIEVLVRGVAK